MLLGKTDSASVTFGRRLLYAIAIATGFFAVALYVGITQTKIWMALSLIGTSIVLEAQPGVAASIALGFHPLAGAAVSISANLIPIPLLLLTFHEITTRWHWARRKVERAERWSRKYRHYGVGALVLLSPFLGAYLCVAIGHATGWKPYTVLLATLIGMVASVLFISYGGHWVIGWFIH